MKTDKEESSPEQSPLQRGMKTAAELARSLMFEKSEHESEPELAHTQSSTYTIFSASTPPEPTSSHSHIPTLLVHTVSPSPLPLCLP